MSTVLRLEAVTSIGGRARRGRPGRPALDSVDLAVEAGEVVALAGPPGSGRSTLLHVAAGLTRPVSGAVLVTGRDVAGMGEAALARFRRQRIGLVAPIVPLLDGLPALDNVLLPARLAGADQRAARARAGELLDRLEVPTAVRRALPGTLTPSERRLVEIARALVIRPSLVLADEPAAVLDDADACRVLDLLGEVGQDGDQSLIVALDSRQAAAVRAQRVVRLLHGRIAEDVELAPSAAPPHTDADPVREPSGARPEVPGPAAAPASGRRRGGGAWRRVARWSPGSSARG